MRTSDRVYEDLRREILDGRLRPGTVLGEIEQSTRLGVSRTPLREALVRLTADGLVSSSGGRGLAVAEVSLDHIRDLFDAREGLEIQAARLAARRRDVAVFEALHREFAHAGELLDADDPTRSAYYELVGRLDAAIDDAAANAYLLAPLRSIRTHIARIRRLSRDNPERLRAAAQEHLMIIEAIIEGSENLAAHAVELHLHRSLAGIIDSLATATATATEADGERQTA